MEASACAAPWKRSDSIEELLRELDDGTHRKEGAAETRDEDEDEEDAGIYEGGGAESEEERRRESMDGTGHEEDTAATRRRARDREWERVTYGRDGDEDGWGGVGGNDLGAQRDGAGGVE